MSEKFYVELMCELNFLWISTEYHRLTLVILQRCDDSKRNRAKLTLFFVLVELDRSFKRSALRLRLRRESKSSNYKEEWNRIKKKKKNAAKVLVLVNSEWENPLNSINFHIKVNQSESSDLLHITSICVRVGKIRMGIVVEWKTIWTFVNCRIVVNVKFLEIKIKSSSDTSKNNNKSNWNISNLSYRRHHH